MENKIIILISTGECREVNKGDWFEYYNNLSVWLSDKKSERKYDVYIKHEIEVPNKARKFVIDFLDKLNFPIQFSNKTFTINKNKVKKWRWITNINNYMGITNYMTEEEIVGYCQNYKNVLYYEKIDNSEQEF